MIERFAQALDLLHGMKPGIEADRGAPIQPGPKPVGQFRLRPVHRGEDRGDLGADLHAIAPVHEDPRFAGRDGAEPRRTREPREPGKPFVAGGDIFPLKAVGPRHQQGIEPLLHHQGAQGSQTGRTGRRIGRRVEALEHHAATRRRRRRRGSASKRAASCSVIAPASCSASVIVTARL